VKIFVDAENSKCSEISKKDENVQEDKYKRREVLVKEFLFFSLVTLVC
jgi:hypothetical protein